MFHQENGILAHHPFWLFQNIQVVQLPKLATLSKIQLLLVSLIFLTFFFEGGIKYGLINLYCKLKHTTVTHASKQTTNQQLDEVRLSLRCHYTWAGATHHLPDCPLSLGQPCHLGGNLPSLEARIQGHSGGFAADSSPFYVSLSRGYKKTTDCFQFCSFSIICLQIYKKLETFL